MSKIIITILGIYLGAPFSGTINSDPVFLSSQDCQESLESEDIKYQAKILLGSLLQEGYSELKIVSMECKSDETAL